MNMQAEKIKLIKLLEKTEDLGLIREIWDLVKAREEKGDRWEEWNEDVKNDVEEAIRQADAGELIPHEKAVTLLKKWV